MLLRPNNRSRHDPTRIAMELPPISSPRSVTTGTKWVVAEATLIFPAGHTHTYRFRFELQIIASWKPNELRGRSFPSGDWAEILYCGLTNIATDTVYIDIWVLDSTNSPKGKAGG